MCREVRTENVIPLSVCYSGEAVLISMSVKTK